MISPAKYNRRALGTVWTLSDLPVDWEGYTVVLSGDLDHNLTIDDDELDEIDWQTFSDAVRDFQEESGLEVDGKLGPNTLKQLRKQYQSDLPPASALFTLGDLSLKRASIPTAPPKNRIVGENKVERAICNLWNNYGQAIATQAQSANLPVDAALAVFCVESKKAYDPATGLVIIRFEPHVFKRKSGREVAWSRGGQSAEWQNFTHAFDANPDAAVNACSYGLPQLMGFNWRVTEYSDARAMMLGFQDSCIAQVKGFFGYVKSRKLENAIHNRDWRTFARKYNGAGRVDIYSTNLGRAMRTIVGLKEDGHQFSV